MEDGGWRGAIDSVRDKDYPNLMNQLAPWKDGPHYRAILLLGFDQLGDELDLEYIYSTLPPELNAWTAWHEHREGKCDPDHHPTAAAKGFQDHFWCWYSPVAAGQIGS
jgi:hypothetical protein